MSQDLKLGTREMASPGPTDELVSVARTQAALVLSESRLAALCTRRGALLDSRTAISAESAAKADWRTLGGGPSAAIIKLSPADSLAVTGRALAALEAEIGELERLIEAYRSNLSRLPDWLVTAATTGALPPDALLPPRS